MATLLGGSGGLPVLSGGPVAPPGGVNLSSAQTGNGVSSNVCDRGGSTGPALLRISTVAGTTVTIAVEGSPDGTSWFNIPFATAPVPGTVSVANITITTTTTNYYYLQADYPWRFVRLTSARTRA
jgi:hypothetical protein